MSSTVAKVLGMTMDDHPLKEAFLKWQCRVRQLSMRDNMGRPDDGIMPELTLAGESEPMGHIITVMSKMPAHSRVPEFKHMVKRTNDPAQRRDKAIELFSETYYQKAREFSDILTATFPPDSEGATTIRRAEFCKLKFSAYNQTFELQCKVWRLAPKNPLHQATWWHNQLFNPDLPGDTIVLGFEPDWSKSTADPSPG